MRLSLRTLLLIVALCGGFFATDNVYRESWRPKYSRHLLLRSLAFDVHNGDTVAQVSKQFDEIKIISNDEYEKSYGSTPLQVTPYRVTSGHSSSVITFSDGKLVGHANKRSELALQKHEKVPPLPWYFQFGSATLYVPFALLVLIITLVRVKRR